MEMNEKDLSEAINNIKEKNIKRCELEKEKRELILKLDEIKKEIKTKEKEIKSAVTSLNNSTKNFYKPEKLNIKTIQYCFDSLPIFFCNPSSVWKTLDEICKTWVYYEDKKSLKLLNELTTTPVNKFCVYGFFEGSSYSMNSTIITSEEHFNRVKSFASYYKLFNTESTAKKYLKNANEYGKTTYPKESSIMYDYYFSSNHDILKEYFERVNKA